MPPQNLTDEQIAYRERLAGDRVLAGSDRVCDLIDAGPHERLQRVAFRARQLREDVQRLTDEHPGLGLVADALAVEEQRLREYAEAV